MAGSNVIYNRDSENDIIKTKAISQLSDGTNIYVIKDSEAIQSIATGDNNG